MSENSEDSQPQIETIVSQPQGTEESIKTEIRDAIFKIFLTFANYSKADRTFFISSRTVQRLYSRIKSKNKSRISVSELDLMVKKKSGKANVIDFNQFTDLLAIICSILLKNEFALNPKETLFKFIQTNFDLSFEDNSSVFKETASGHLMLQNIIEQHLISLEANGYFTQMQNAFLEIYKVYFEYETKIKAPLHKVREMSSEHLINFAHDFEIIPFVMSVNQVVVTWMALVSDNTKVIIDEDNKTLVKGSENVGLVFTLNKFIAFLYYACQFKFEKLGSYTNDLAEFEKLLIFFEKMENSKGYSNLNRKRNKPQLSSMRLIPPKETLMEKKPDFMKHYAKSQSGFFNSSNFNKSDMFRTAKSSITFMNETESNAAFAENHQILKSVFRHFSLFGDKSKLNSMNYNSFRIFCDNLGAMEYDKEALVDKGLTLNDLSSIFNNSSRVVGEEIKHSLFKDEKKTRSCQLKFETFLVALKKISLLVFSNKTEEEGLNSLLADVVY